ncbi:ROK family transcriptional regulator [Streptomyces sp. B6B3]|uniref:ROK family transcriptional regulator n=1 Tax=Streptomyces sp. B6B3 TaxID=3153570 RepID=UPI00325D1E0F
MPAMSGPHGGTANVLGPSSGQVLALITGGVAETRADIARVTGLARSTVTHRVEALVSHGYLDEYEDGRSTGGRPSRRLRLRTRDRVTVGVDLGATHYRVSLVDVGGAELAVREQPMRISEGPDAVLEHVAHAIQELLDEAGQRLSALCAIGVGVPGPVEFATGTPVDPPLMPGWDRYPIPRFLGDRFGVTALVDNDVNVMALAEWRRVLPHTNHLLFVKMGTGIGCGIIANGELYRGAQGSAGDIGHTRVGVDDTPCRCGNTGCLEAVAGGAVLARRIGAGPGPGASTREVVDRVTSGEQEAVRMVRDAGRAVGEVLSALINFANPEAIVIGGALAAVHRPLLAGVREAVYRRSHPLATRHLLIEPSRLGENAATLGAAFLAIGHVLAPEQVDTALLAVGS